MTSNEIRQVIGMKPSSDPKADQLINSNLNHPEEDASRPTGTGAPTADENTNQKTQPIAESRSFGDIPISELMKKEEDRNE